MKKIFHSKQGSVALAIIAVLLAAAILVGFLVNIAQRECNNNKDCPDDAYCSVKHECEKYPDKIIVRENNFLPAAIILSVGIIIAAYLHRGKKQGEKKQE